MRRLAERFGEAARTCATVAQLRDLVADVSAELGFDHFALLHHGSLLHPARSYIRIENYPAEWVSEILGNGLAPHDPVHQASRRSNIAFEWSEVGQLIRLGTKQKEILKRSRFFGLGDGLTIPVNVPGEPAGSCSFAVRAGRELPRKRLMCAELIGAHAFRSARRLTKFPGPAACPHLSRREVQCLRLLAAGKTDWEIARILGISVETARQYVKRARFAYQAATRSQLVALALRDGWLSFEDAVDPRN